MKTTIRSIRTVITSSKFILFNLALDTREKVKLVVSDIQQKYPQQFQQIMMERIS